MDDDRYGVNLRTGSLQDGFGDFFGWVEEWDLDYGCVYDAVSGELYFRFGASAPMGFWHDGKGDV